MFFLSAYCPVMGSSAWAFPWSIPPCEGFLGLGGKIEVVVEIILVTGNHESARGTIVVLIQAPPVMPKGFSDIPLVKLDKAELAVLKEEYKIYVC